MISLLPCAIIALVGVLIGQSHASLPLGHLTRHRQATGQIMPHGHRNVPRGLLYRINKVNTQSRHLMSTKVRYKSEESQQEPPIYSHPLHSRTRQFKLPRYSEHPDSPFRVFISCKYFQAALCAKIVDTLHLIGGTFLASHFQFRQKINVEIAEYDDLMVERLELIAFSDITSFVRGRIGPDDPVVAYPIALAKQLIEPHKLPRGRQWADIILGINSRHRLWTSEHDRYEDIRPDTLDLTYILLHEVMHGMGFYSSLLNNFDVLHPPLKHSSLQTKTNQWHGPDAFERHLWDSQGPISPRLDRIRSIHLRGLTEDEILEYLRKQPALRMNTSQSIYFRTYRGTMVQLDGTGIECPLSHLSTIYANGPEFLMTPHAINGTSLNDIIRRRGAKSPIGDVTVEVMKTIGWSLVGEPDEWPGFEMDPEDPLVLE